MLLIKKSLVLLYLGETILAGNIYLHGSKEMTYWCQIESEYSSIFYVVPCLKKSKFGFLKRHGYVVYMYRIKPERIGLLQGKLPSICEIIL